MIHRLGLISALASASGVVLLSLALAASAGAAAPANDNFTNAAALSGLPANATGTNVDATTESGEPELTDIVGTPAGRSVWWSWTAPSDGDVTVDTCGSSFDTVLAVYTGGSVEALTPVARNDIAFDDCGGTDQSGDSKLSFTADSGQVYRIAVDGSVPYWLSDMTGSIALALNKSPQPANDDFANAAVLTEYANEQAAVQQTNAGASKETGEPNHAGDAGGHSVWWSWTAPRSGLVYFYACGPAVGTVLAVYTGDSVGALSEVASAPADIHCGSDLRFRASAGQTYHIAVDGAGGAIGGFYLQKSTLAPPNDEFENATPLSGLSAEASGVSGATSEPGEPNHAGNAAGRSAWWRWTAPANGPVQVDTCGSFAEYSNFDTVLAVYTGGAVNALSEVASNDDLASCAPRSGVAFTASAGQTYRIAVDGAAGSSSTGLVVVSLRGPAATGGPPPAVTPTTPVKKQKCKKHKKKRRSADAAKKKKCNKKKSATRTLRRGSV